MTVRRIVADLETADPKALASFYVDVFGMDIVMDGGFIVTVATGQDGPVQLSFASEGGSGTPVPALSIEVDDLDAVLDRCRLVRADPEYGPVDEPWGVRRFFVRDPAGTLLNVLTHVET